ncbi:MAG: hypothetical protein V3V62_09950 [bacterium]
MAAIGSLATAGALIVAIIVFGLAASESRSESEKRAADAIRKTLVSAAQESQALRDIVRGGSPYVAAAAEIADEFGRRLGPAAASRDFWAHLGADKSMMISIATRGWNASPPTRKIERRMAELKRLRVLLRGKLVVLVHPIELLDSVVRDGFSPLIFYRVLTAAPELLMTGKRDERRVVALLNALTAGMQNSAIAVYVAGHQKLGRLLNEFIQKAASALADLEDEALLALARSRSKTPPRGATHTGRMLVLLGDLRSFLPKEAHQKLARISLSIKREITVQKRKRKRARPKPERRGARRK